jgi:hypothetical protein
MVGEILGVDPKSRPAWTSAQQHFSISELHCKKEPK